VRRTDPARLPPPPTSRIEMHLHDLVLEHIAA
jgi:hypothetical protein